MRWPSGDQRTFDPFTSARLRVPSAPMIQTEDSCRSFILSTHVRT